MGIAFPTDRNPTVTVRAKLIMRGGITVFPWQMTTGNPQRLDDSYYPLGYLLNTPYIKAEFGAAGCALAFEVRITTPYPAQRYNQEIPVYLSISYEAFAGQPGRITRDILLFKTRATETFDLTGNLYYAIDASEFISYDTLNDTCHVTLRARRGGKVSLGGNLGGHTFAHSVTIPADSNRSGDVSVNSLVSAASTGTTLFRKNFEIPEMGFEWRFLGTPETTAACEMELIGLESGGQKISYPANLTGDASNTSDARGRQVARIPARSAPLHPGRDESYTALCRVYGTPPKIVHVRGRLFAMDQPYPQSLKANLVMNYSDSTRLIPMSVDGNGWSDSGVQETDSISAELRCAVSTGANQFFFHQGKYLDRISLSLDSKDLADHGEHPDDITLPFAGHLWDALQVRQDKSVTVDDASSLSPLGNFQGQWFPAFVSGVATSEVTATGSAIQIDTLLRDSDNAGCIRTLPGVWFSGYRYLEIRIRSRRKKSLPFRLEMGGKFWKASTGDAEEWRTIRFDLCHEMGRTDGKRTPVMDLRDSIRWPGIIEGVSVGRESPLFGVNFPIQMAFLGLRPDSRYEIESIKLVRDSEPTMSFLQTFQEQRQIAGPYAPTLTPYEQIWGREWRNHSNEADEADTVYYQRGILGITDGRMSLEEPVRAYDINNGGRRFRVIDIKSMSGFIDRSENVGLGQPLLLGGMEGRRNPGWHCVSLSEPVTSGAMAQHLSEVKADTLSSVQDARYLWGGGTIWRNGSTCEPGIDIPVPDSGLTIPAQMTFRFLSFWSGAGDVFGYAKSSGDVSETHPTAINLRFGKVFRGQLKNLIIGATGADTVYLRQSPENLPAGQGDVDDIGRFETGPPYSRMTRDTVQDGSDLIPLRRLYEAYLNHPGSSRKAKGLNIQSRRQRRITFRAPAGAGVSVLREPIMGFYARVTSQPWGVIFRRSLAGVPEGASAWALETFITDPAGTGSLYVNPAVARTPEGNIRAVWERRMPPLTAGGDWSYSVWAAFSDDEGDTWSDTEMIQNGARNPRWFKGLGENGMMIATYVLPLPDDASLGKIVGQLWTAGDYTGSRFTFQRLRSDGALEDFTIEIDSGYDGIQVPELSGRWVMTATASGDTGTSDWQSSDEGRTWQKL